MNPRDVLQDHATADKALIALLLLRQNKTVGLKGIGPNRDDLPLFQTIVSYWHAAQPCPKDDIMRARARVTKYGRQLLQSPYWPQITNPAITRATMLQDGHRTLQAVHAETELRNYLEEVAQYGHW